MSRAGYSACGVSGKAEEEKVQTGPTRRAALHIHPHPPSSSIILIHHPPQRAATPPTLAGMLVSRALVHAHPPRLQSRSFGQSGACTMVIPPYCRCCHAESKQAYGGLSGSLSQCPAERAGAGRLLTSALISPPNPVTPGCLMDACHSICSFSGLYKQLNLKMVEFQCGNHLYLHGRVGLASAEALFAPT